MRKRRLSHITSAAVCGLCGRNQVMERKRAPQDEARRVSSARFHGCCYRALGLLDLFAAVDDDLQPLVGR